MFDVPDTRLQSDVLKDSLDPGRALPRIQVPLCTYATAIAEHHSLAQGEWGVQLRVW